MHTSQKRQWLGFLKWVCYTLLLLLAFLLQTAPWFLEVFGVKPVLLAGIAIAIAFFESELPAGIFAMIAGLLMDYSSGRYMGSCAAVFMILAVALCLLTHYLSLPHFWSYCLWSFASLFLGFHIFFLFEDALQWTAGTGAYYLKVLWPQLLVSYVASLPLYFVVHRLHRLVPVAED